MKSSVQLKIAAFATAVLSTMVAFVPMNAQTLFGKKELDQSRYIAVAQPLAGGSTYKLLVIQQVSNSRACWDEAGVNPIQVDMLLNNFNYDGICAPKRDSNGYSIRMADEDLAPNYSLRLEKRGNDVVLIGSPFLGSSSSNKVEIGRTNGMINDFMKINLNPGWRFTERIKDGKSLGHIYFTSDQQLGSIPSDGGNSGGNTGGTKFADIRNDVYGKEIDEAVTQGFVAGYNDGTFRPLDTLTREQLVSMVVESLQKIPGVNVNVPSSTSYRPYPDVEASRWSAAKIEWARANSLITGYSDGSFRPTQQVTRAEMMAILRRAAEKGKELRGLSTTLSPKDSTQTFSDTSGHWANSVISLMSGYCDVASPLNERGTAFYPNTAAQRNYAAAATLRMLKCVKSDN